ncbi:MAG: PQQ-dependent sugar dehydrogenase [Candidatus Levybacteria bacterium]|nr:PQQ-dependent sugar dehydrogenase [Candidatus Levybacteria bacterium]
MKKLLIFGAVVILVISLVSLYQSRFGKLSPSLSDISGSPVPNETSESSRITEVANNLDVPWEMVFLPNQDILLTERTGSLKLISKGQTSTIAKIPDVKVYGEGGLMGLALHPNFTSNNLIYLYYTYSGQNNQTLNRVVRYKFENNTLSQQKIIVDKIPGAIYHNGGRLKFGPDGFLYITTGDSGNPSLAQNKNSLAGKILRTTDEGKVVPGNPFDNLVYSYGHRNPQGLAWDEDGRLFETEHGQSATDEVNIIIKGRNYGWPTITGAQTRSGMQSPLIQSGAETWAPAGATFVNGTLFFGGLRGQALYELKTNGNVAQISQHFLKEFGRIRDVVLGPDNFLYISTSNRDGRGDTRTKDDKILKIDPAKL